MLADVSQLGCQRGGRHAGGRPHELDERSALVVARRSIGEGRLQARDRLGISAARRQVAIVDELLEGSKRRVLVGDPGEHQLLEAVRRRLGAWPDPRELLPEPVQQASALGPELCVEGRQRRRHRPRAAARLVAGHEQVADLVEEPECADLAGLDRRSPAGSVGVHPAGQPADARRVGHDQVAARPDQRSADGVSPARLATDMELASHRPIVRPGPGHRATTPGQAVAGSAGRVLATCSTARRRSSRPDGSKS